MPQTVQHHQCAQKQAAPALYFCPLEAEAIGLNEAIVVARLRFWLSRTKHIFGGRPWVYNTYPEWQRQFPFWSVFTVKAIFRRLERLGVLESTQRFNANRWYRRKWYTLNAEALAELVGCAVVPNAAEPAVAEAAAGETTAMGATAMEAAAPIEGEQVCAIEGIDQAPIEGIEQAPIEGIDFVLCLESGRSPDRSSKRACASEPDEEARSHPPDPKSGKEAVNELDVAYETIPEGERQTWYERADRTLEAAGMPEWMRITPTVKEMALRLWVGETIPGLATG
ncbi:MAG: hypothetical protein ETSY1_46395 (plasmid) [Candidatus Entotheonella factor]|uniref:Uncharacterized protein n=1 Tax=Entotheonella factor TaxID=1429438 RepID=W4M162_ENTF1|nr:MAG: hypothetical protein ETSY1_46395 [Candidatus Entotheonella factor]